MSSAEPDVVIDEAKYAGQDPSDDTPLLNLIVIEEDDKTAGRLCRTCESLGYRVNPARVKSGDELYETLRKGSWDLILSAPGLSGFSAGEVLDVLRQRRADIPVVVFGCRIEAPQALDLLRDGARDVVDLEAEDRLRMIIKREVNELENRRELHRCKEVLDEYEQRLVHFLKRVEGSGPRGAPEQPGCRDAPVAMEPPQTLTRVAREETPPPPAPPQDVAREEWEPPSAPPQDVAQEEWEPPPAPPQDVAWEESEPLPAPPQVVTREETPAPLQDVAQEEWEPPQDVAREESEPPPAPPQDVAQEESEPPPAPPQDVAREEWEPPPAPLQDVAWEESEPPPPTGGGRENPHGICDRASFLEALGEVLDGRTPQGLLRGLMYIQLDNDFTASGRPAVTSVPGYMSAVEGMLRKAVPAPHLLGRYDESVFVALLTHRERQKIIDTAQRIRVMIEKLVVNIDDGAIRATCSVGVCVAAGVGRPIALIAQAKAACNKAVSSGGNKVSIAVASAAVKPAPTAQSKSVPEVLAKAARNKAASSGGSDASIAVAGTVPKSKAAVQNQPAPELRANAPQTVPSKSASAGPPEPRPVFTGDEWSRRLQQALYDNAYRLVYQPVVNFHAAPTEIYEILLRMFDKGEAEILPGEFIPQAEERGLMPAIDRWVIQHAADALMERHQAGYNTRFFIKISNATMDDGEFLTWLRELLESKKIPPGSMIFQFSELALADRVEAALRFVRELVTLKFAAALDHFGTQENSLELAGLFPVKYLRIHGSLSQNLDKSTESQNKLKGIVDAAHAAGKITIATFVQDPYVLSILWRTGVDYVQGFYFQTPNPDMDYDFSSSIA